MDLGEVLEGLLFAEIPAQQAIQSALVENEVEHLLFERYIEDVVVIDSELANRPTGEPGTVLELLLLSGYDVSVEVDSGELVDAEFVDALDDF